ncbi:MAG TPA: SMP-30/gluconolactonase/LRE family protein [Acidimicrobiales bacterium]|jgi:sugar lactone lactonase YvrE|nr:SMP-30/gluconolactonase/LRE family protein [Acidimicrobiales bacterium]
MSSSGDLRVVLEDLVFPEGPRWRDGHLYFSDIHAGKVICVTPTGSAALVCEVPGLPSGLGWDPQDRLLIASTTTKALVRLEHDGTLTTVADLSGLCRWTINDMVVDGAGRAYIGDVGFELGRDDFRPGQVVLVQPDGTSSVVDDDMRFPNGSMVTPDGRTLLVGESFGGRLTAFDIQADGSLANKRVWAQLPQGAVPDGSCLDAEGAVWTASPTTREVLRVAEGGEVLARVSTGDQGAYACMLGGNDRRTLFVCTAKTHDPKMTGELRSGRIEAVEVDVPGAGWP